MFDFNKAVVIIVNWNGLRFLNDCIISVVRQTYRNYEVFLVDNGSTDNSIGYVKEHFPQVRIIALDRNYGFAKANNIAMKMALNERVGYIALLNNDTKADERWLATLVKTMAMDTRIGICASKMLLMSNPAIIDSTGHIFQSGKVGDRGLGELDSGQYDDKLDVVGACAGACLYRREMLEDIGLFDESFVSYYEDAELSWRAHNSGWKARYVPEAVALHYHGGTTRSNPETDRALMKQSSINIATMIRRHAPLSQKIRTSCVWLRMAITMDLRRLIKGSGEDGKPYFDRLRILWSKIH